MAVGKLDPHAKPRRRLPAILNRLESFYGKQEPTWPTDPYLFLVWWHCGYPASDAACAKGWESLRGRMVPELRAMRLKEIAARVKDEFGGDLRAALVGPLARVRKILKKFPNIADPGADRILLFAGLAPVAAVPSNCPHVIVRIQHGQERENYGATYREAQKAIEDEIPQKFDPLIRAYLLLKRHGQELCKRTKPKCENCPVNSSCAFFAGSRRGRSSLA